MFWALECLCIAFGNSLAEGRYMKRFCFGTFATVLNHCKPSKYKPPQYKLLSTILSSACQDYENAGINQSVSTQLIKCKESLSDNIVSDARDADPKTIARHFSERVVKCLDPNKKKLIILAILDIIENDCVIANDTVVDLIGNTTKLALLSQLEFSFAEFLAGVFLYSAIAVDNKVGHESVKEITEEYINELPNTKDIKIVDRISEDRAFYEKAPSATVRTGKKKQFPRRERKGIGAKIKEPYTIKSIFNKKLEIIVVATGVVAFAFFFGTLSEIKGLFDEPFGDEITSDESLGDEVTLDEPLNDEIPVQTAGDEGNVKGVREMLNEPPGDFNPADVMISDENKVYSTDAVRNALEFADVSNWETINNIRIKYGDTELKCSTIDEIFDFFEKQGILNCRNTKLTTRSTFSASESDFLNGGEFADKIEKANAIEETQSDEELSLDDNIRLYVQKIELRESALKFTDEHLRRSNSPSATVPRLLVLLAKDYRELGILYAKRGDDGDRNLACRFYAQSVLCYAELYRMFTLEGTPEKIHDNNIIYWIAGLYHHLGDLTSTVSHYRIDEFGTATAMQEEYRKDDTERDFSDYSIYFSAIASHKLIIEFEKTGDIPVDLAEYFESAINNYLYSRDSNIKPVYRDDAKSALKWLKTQCGSFVELYPEKQYLLQLFK
jgi:hypothetical protein